MKELLQQNQCATAFELYSLMRANYFDGHTITAKDKFKALPKEKRAEFIYSMSPYDPAYAFFSTMGFTETV